MDPRPARSNGGPPSWLVGVVALAAGSLLLAGCGGGGGGEDAGGGSGSQGYPDREIAFIVPFAAGGPTDTVTRLVAEPMSAKLGQQIVVRNVEGAGGTVAAGEVANADGDGYTVLMHHIGMSTAPALYPNLAYKPLEDFKTVGTKAVFQWKESFDKNNDPVVYRFCLWSVSDRFTLERCDAKPTTELSRAVYLQSGQSYFWKVLAEDGKGGASESQTRRVTAK